jgi:hypothetical protein
MFNFDQTRLPAIRYAAFAGESGGDPLLTSAECRTQAEQKLAQAEHDSRHRRRLITAAEAWLFLASQLTQVEAAVLQIQEEVPGPGTQDRTERG